MGDYLLLCYKHDLQAYNINSELFSKSQEVNVKSINIFCNKFYLF